MNEDLLNGYTCQHCEGDIIVDGGMSNKNWKIYKCVDCGSKTPLSPMDLMKLAGNG